MSTDKPSTDSKPFPWQLMQCIVCNKQEQHDPAVESNWRALQLDNYLYYVCPDHLPADGAPIEVFTEAFKPILQRAQELHRAQIAIDAIRRLLASNTAVNVRVKASDLYMVIVAVQMALRHPAAAQSFPLQQAKATARSWHKHFKREIQNILELGWNPQFDQADSDRPAIPQQPPSQANPSL